MEHRPGSKWNIDRAPSSFNLKERGARKRGKGQKEVEKKKGRGIETKGERKGGRVKRARERE